MTISSLALLSFTFNACKKDAIDQVVKSPTAAENAKKTQLLVDGFDYNLIGEAHNNYLIYVRANPNFLTMTEEQRFDYGTSYVDPYFGARVITDYNSALPGANYAINLSNDLMYNEVLPGDQLFQDEKITEEMIPFVDQLAEIFLEAADTINHEPYSPAQFAQIIEVLEGDIISNFPPEIDYSDTTGNEGVVLLGMCSIAKYSYDYWYNNLNNWPIGGAGQIMPMGPFSFLKKVWHGIKVAGADAWGFVGEGTVSVGTSGASINFPIKKSVDAAGVASKKVASN